MARTAPLDKLASTLDARLAELNSMDRIALGAAWERTYGCKAPKHAQIAFLRGAIAWQWQAEHAVQVGHPVDVEKMLRAVRRPEPATRLPIGTRLLREWHGVTHEVLVVAGGYEYEGKVYTSLTAIARLVTNTSRSGIRFFGLKP